MADVGCGYGLALSILAAAYPASTFHGFDTSKISLAKAAEATSGLANVELFDPSTASGQMAAGAYDWVLTLDAIHDMTRPAEVLKTVRPCRAAVHARAVCAWVMWSVAVCALRGAQLAACRCGTR